MFIESRRWFQYVVALAAVALTLALALPIYFSLRTEHATAALALPFLAAGAIGGFDRLLTLLLPPVLTRLWPELDRPAL